MDLHNPEILIPPPGEPDSLQGIWLGTVPYARALELQRQVHREVSGLRRPDTILCLEHPPVFTLGKRGGLEHLLVPMNDLGALGAELINTDRGGLITFHGPGQLVIYPILNLEKLGRSLSWYVEALMRSLRQALVELGLDQAMEDLDRPGIWLNGKKIASVGVRLERGTTLHGAAVNICMDLDWFKYIAPCGMAVAMTSLKEETGWCPGLKEVLPTFLGALAMHLRPKQGEKKAFSLESWADSLI